MEIAADARVLPKEQLLVHLLEVEREIECAAQARIPKLLTAQVENESLHPTGIVDRELFLDRPFFGHRRKIVGRRPLLSRVLRDPIDLIGLEGFERNDVVPEELVTQLVEIILANLDRKIGAPIILHSL